MTNIMTKPVAAAGQHTNHRAREILEQIQLAGGTCRISFLAERLGVTEETIRRNIKSLEKDGYVRKVHGGVHLVESQDEESFQRRMQVNPLAKQLIAASLADLIQDGDSLFLDIGSTTAYIAKALLKHKNLFIVTNSISVAHTLATRNNNRIFLAGGELRAHDGGAFGLEAANFVRKFNVQYAVLSVGGIHASDGFMLHDIEEADFAREVMNRAKTCIIAADSEKFNRRAPIVVDNPKSFDLLVTDKTPGEDIMAMMQENNIDLRLAGK